MLALNSEASFNGSNENLIALVVEFGNKRSKPLGLAVRSTSASIVARSKDNLT